MKIKLLKVKNFRGYRNETIVEFSKLTAFIGKNDIGKSSLLEALDIFFNDSRGAIKLDKNDVNVEENKQNNQETVITVCFTNIPEEITIDSTTVTSATDEYLLNAQGEFEVVKKYKNGGAAKVYIKAMHPSNPDCSDLLLKKNAELKKIISDKGIVCDNLSNNVIMRQAIWNHYNENLQLAEREIDVTREDAKKIWEKLNVYLPVYSLFQSDRKNSDGDDEVQDPLKEAVKQILSDSSLQENLNNVAEIVKTKLTGVVDRTLLKLKEVDATVAESLTPVIPPTQSLKWQDVFKAVSISGDNNIPINKRGSGTKRLILLSFFRGEVERIMNEGDNTGVIYAIEEPETSQHSGNQYKLIEALKNLSENDNVQIILTTHSSFLVKQLDYSMLRLIKYNENANKVVTNVEPSRLQYPSLNEVNYLAFGEVTEEYHNELYGHIEEANLFPQYKQGRPQQQYIKKKNNSTQLCQITLTEYIRHQIHHPENTLNARYTKDELKQSIEDMRKFIEHNNI